MLPLDGLPYRVDFRRIPEFREWTVALNLHDLSRKVDDSYVLFSRLGYGSFDAAYVITRLPETMTDAATVLAAIQEMQKERAGGVRNPSFILAETPLGRGLEMIVGGRTGSTCFPTAAFQYATSAQESSIGISRFVVRDGHLIEYALALPWPQGESQEAAIKRAGATMERFMGGLETTPPGDDLPR